MEKLSNSKFKKFENKVVKDLNAVRGGSRTIWVYTGLDRKNKTDDLVPSI